MRKIKLLMMLTLLCVGVGSAWAQTYTAVPSDYWEDRGGGVTFTDGTLVFSTRKRTGYSGHYAYSSDGSFSYGNMATGEVCVGLLMNEQEEVTDYIIPFKYSNGSSTYTETYTSSSAIQDKFGSAGNPKVIDGSTYTYVGENGGISNGSIKASSRNPYVYQRVRTINTPVRDKKVVKKVGNLRYFLYLYS